MREYCILHLNRNTAPTCTDSEPRDASGLELAWWQNPDTPRLIEVDQLLVYPSVSHMTANLVGPERVRRHPHLRHWSVPADGFSDGPGAFRVPVPIIVGVAPPSPIAVAASNRPRTGA